MSLFVNKAVRKFPAACKSLFCIPTRHFGLLSYDYPHFDKKEQAHRDTYIHKTSETLEFYAKKMRDYYFEQGNYPTEKIFLHAKRVRAPYESIGYLWAKKEVAGMQLSVKSSGHSRER